MAAKSGQSGGNTLSTLETSCSTWFCLETLAFNPKSETHCQAAALSTPGFLRNIFGVKLQPTGGKTVVPLIFFYICIYIYFLNYIHKKHLKKTNHFYCTASMHLINIFMGSIFWTILSKIHNILTLSRSCLCFYHSPIAGQC